MIKLTNRAMLAAFMVLAGAPALADGDPAKGEKNFKVCSACHTLEAGKNRVGPSLHALFGRKAGTADGYSYSKDLKAAGEKGLVWTEESLFDYLADPGAFLRKYLEKPSVSNKMVNRFPKKDFRDDVIAYLEKATR